MSEDYEILPTVLVIHPSGYTEFLDADLSSMTSGEIESLIYGEDIENVFETIDNLSGILRRETDDDGRYDSWS